MTGLHFDFYLIKEYVAWVIFLFSLNSLHESSAYYMLFVNEMGMPLKNEFVLGLII